ncbi:MAG: HAMP domain-containing sensor histidine kinase, partial [Bacteroidota bacterium]
FLLLGFLGTALGVGFYSIAIGLPSIAHDTTHALIYTGLFATMIGLVFARKKEIEGFQRLEKNRLLGGAIGHEVTNTIGIMNMMASGLETTFKYGGIKVHAREDGDRFYELDKEMYDFIMALPNQLREQGDRAQQTIDMLLTSIKTDLLVAKPSIFLLGEATKTAVKEYHFSREEHRALVSVDVQEDCKIRFSEHYLQHILFNFLKNTYRHGGLDCQVTITVKGNRLYYRDNGQGIANKDLPHIFDYFYSTDERGTGIGLALAKLAMETFDGHITCHSQQGEGSYTEFILDFPNPKDVEQPAE